MRNRPLLVVVGAAVALAAIGLATVRSAGLALPEQSALWPRQLAWLLVGSAAALVVARADLRRLKDRGSLLIHGALILATIATFAGSGVNSVHRWLHLGGVNVQPSEPLKLGLVLALASCFSRPVEGPRHVRDLALPAGLLACTLIPVLLQPDLGTAVGLALVAASALALERFSRGAWASLAIGAIGSLATVWFTQHDYQRARLTAFLHGGDPLTTGYQSDHALRLVGAGRLLGGSPFAGSEPYPLPEAHGDFAFAVWAHEHGFAGTALVLALYLALVLAALRIAAGARDRFEARVAVGVAAIVFWQAVINAGMVMGLLPVVGVTLPLISYGGSSAFTCLVGVGLLASVARRPTAA
ncbi:FtsW/RodA/SpoVE family cell cycle protein [Polyangium sp. 15x6]|uniref:FtsW/RodA/SpoVE family cell cycle protein n=1 Tax=Polyangium sp. 15x6 TaxID=3042687 RepID=UPI00249B004D|nr:FtsW/RodA/SpoVE family cell cycle protein [Polyangium sp. 15x6]MDI3283454.1 FtsW/RodA/SpoVE family cell cycle protein [Polyangium sp. 15x6]